MEYWGSGVMLDRRKRDVVAALDLQKKVILIHDLFLRLAEPFDRTIYTEAMRLRGFDVKMYPRWPSKPLSPDAHDELGNLFSELGIVEKPARAKTA